MIAEILVDTGPLFAAVDRDDQYHKQAQGELALLAEDGTNVVICIPVVLEAYPLIMRRLGLKTAHTWLEDVSRGSGLLVPDGEDYLQAVRRAQAYEDQPLTLVDCAIAVLSECLGVPVWSYDHHFDILRVLRWP